MQIPSTSKCPLPRENEVQRLKLHTVELEKHITEEKLKSDQKMTSLRDVAVMTEFNLSECMTQTEAGTNAVITVTEDVQALLAIEEGAEKWRDLSMALLSPDPTVQAVQRCLASATFEYELTRSKLSKNGQDVGRPTRGAHEGTGCSTETAAAVTAAS